MRCVLGTAQNPQGGWTSDKWQERDMLCSDAEHLRLLLKASQEVWAMGFMMFTGKNHQTGKKV